MSKNETGDTLYFNSLNKERRPFRLIETLTGRTIARAKDPARFKEVISESEAHRFTVHNQDSGWFSLATIVFNPEEKP
jgi:hypothetical protein